MAQFLDVFLTLVHFAVIGFNLFGWIWRKTRKAHLFFVALTAASWFILGIWFGIGYCPITEWQWQVKESLGETNLPASFVKYYADKVFNDDFDSNVINAITAVCFCITAIISVFLNFSKWRSGRKAAALRNITA